MKILLSGASGFVGGNLALGLSEFHQVLGTQLESSLDPRVKEKIESRVLDLRDRAAVRALVREFQPDVIVHTAAMANVTQCEKDPIDAQSINVFGTENLLNAAKELDTLPLCIFTSTDLVFEGHDESASRISELDALAPKSGYARTKVAAELLCRNYPGTASIFRLALVIGPKVNGKQGFLGWILNALRAGKPCELFHDEYRSPVHVEDLLEATQNCIRQFMRQEPVPEMLHIAGSGCHSRLEIGQTLCKLFGFDESLVRSCSSEILTERPPRAKKLCISCARLEQVLQRPPLDLEEALLNSDIEA